MTEPCIEYSGCTEEETSQQHLEGSCSLLGQRQEQSAVAMSPTAGTDTTMDEHADDLMLSELLISLQGSPVAADYSAGAMEASCTTAPAGAGPHHQQHRGSGRRTAAGAGVSAKASAAGRRTVVHRRKRRDDLAGPCNHCGALTSPQWRKGPKGKPVLCNACGIRFLRNRTLTKVMPKKRRHGMAGGKRSRIAAAMATEGEDEDDFPEHSMAAGDDDLGEAYSAAVSAAAAAAAQAYAAALHPLMMQAGLLPGSSGELYTAQDDTAAAEPATAAAEPSAAAEGADAAAPAAASPFQAAAANKALAAAAAAPAVSALSHDSLFSSRSNSSSRNLLVQLGDCPSLTLALALHQQQQQRRQQEEQEAEAEMQQQSSKYRLPNFPELQLQPPSSPPADSSGATGFVCSPPRTSAAGTPALPAASSPVCSSDSLLQLQHQYSSTTPPLSPLFLGAAGTAAPAAAAAAAAGQGSTGDMVQLVQQLGVALGGVGPAIEFLKLCSGNPAALAAAVAAVAASAAVSAK